MRGKHLKQRCLHFAQRITPAHAGKTHAARSSGRASADHPRACGENKSYEDPEQLQNGSPPRMRGKLYSTFPTLRNIRITPAHAGKTLRKWRISVVDPSPQPRSSLTSRKADASIGSQRAPCAAPV